MYRSIKIDYSTFVLCIILVFMLQMVYLVYNSSFLKATIYIQDAIYIIGILYIYQKREYKFKTLLFISILLVLSFFSYHYSGQSVLLGGIIIIAAGVGYRATMLYKKILILTIAFTGIVFSLGIAGLIPSRIARRGYSSYGFTHPNTLGLMIVLIIGLLIIVFYKQLKVKHYFALALLSFLGWRVTGGRNVLAISLFAIVFCVILRAFGNKLAERKIFRILLYFVVPALFFISIHMAVSFDYFNPNYESINVLLSNRLAMAHTVTLRNTPTLFGQIIQTTLVENSYIVLLYQNGYIFSAIFIIINELIIRKSILNKNFGILVFILAFAIYGISEAFAYNPFVNVALLYLMLKDDSGKIEEQNQTSINQATILER